MPATAFFNKLLDNESPKKDTPLFDPDWASAVATAEELMRNRCDAKNGYFAAQANYQCELQMGHEGLHQIGKWGDETHCLWGNGRSEKVNGIQKG